MSEPTGTRPQSLLQTKIAAPPLRLRHSARQRLLEKMRTNAEARVILVSAPAGYGKSSCLVEWRVSMQAKGVKIAWYSLDEQDNDPARFAAYLAGAFQLADPTLLDDLHGDMPIDLQTLMTHICNSVANRSGQFCLVVDDYHAITSAQIHHSMGHLCDFLPANMQLVIGTRADPPLPLARLRARRQIVEIRVGDLCFDRGEMENLLECTFGWSPSALALEQLEQVTEGWAAGVVLIALALGVENAGADFEQSLQRQLAGYSQTQRHLFDYFAVEVLEQQRPDIRDFLLDTCVLGELEPNICQALTKNPLAQLLLRDIGNANLFLLPLAEDRPCYRYHPLFADFLSHYLTLHESERLRRQHRRAAEWYAAHDQIPAAVTHALHAGDKSLAAHLIEEQGWALLTSRGELETIVRWIAHFSRQELQEFPRLTLYFSRAFYLTGELEQAEVYVQTAFLALGGRGTPSEKGVIGDEGESLRAIALSYQATLVAYQGEIAHGLSLIAQAETLQDAALPLDRVRIANTRAFLHYLQGDVVAARQSYEVALELARGIGHHYLALDAIGYLAQLDLMQGALQRAQVRCREVVEEYPLAIAPLGAVMVPLASVHFEQGRVAEAERVAREVVALAQRGAIPDLLWRAHALLGAILASRGEWELARGEIMRAEVVAARFRSPFMLDYIGAVGARIHLISGEIDQAGAWAARNGKRVRDRSNPEYQHDFEAITLVRIWLRQGRKSEAQELLQQTIALLRGSGRLGYLVEAHLLEAAFHGEAGRSGKAMNALSAALQLAAPEEQARPFLEMEEPLRSLLINARSQGIEAMFAESILARMSSPPIEEHKRLSLTERESEVLQAIAEGCSNQEIANRLCVSVGTVKSHLNHIMDKLDARNRTEAVAKARQLKLLDK